MNRADFHNLVRNPDSKVFLSLGELREILGIYPWFQSAHLLLLKGLKAGDDVRFDSQLKMSAIHVSDRTRLYMLLSGTSPDSKAVSATPGGESLENTDPTAALPGPVSMVEVRQTGPLIARDESAAPDTESEADEPPEAALASAAVQDHDREGEAVEPDTESGSAGQPFVTVRSEEELKAEINRRLAELNALREAAPGPGIADDGLLILDGPSVSVPEGLSDELAESVSDGDAALLEIDEGKAGARSQADLIDRFIELNPRIETPAGRPETEREDLSEQQAEVKVKLVSETLAKIYLEQGYYSRAISIYENLCLKYPEKCSYFAGQIEKINDLIKKG